MPKFMLRGQANVAGTKSYFDRLKFPNDRVFRNPEVPGWYLSGAGFGSYRIHPNNKQHVKALKYALQNGINVIDTATNYMDGMSEEMIGNALHEMIVDTEFERENFVVISKAGYIQGSLLADFSSNHGFPDRYSDLCRYNNSMWYSLDPQFIKDQLEQSRKRLGVDVIDVYLVHNPEYYLFSKLKEKGKDIDLEMELFLTFQALKKAFATLENAVREGKIQFYGISSNTLAAPEDTEGFLDLHIIWTMAKEAAEEIWGDAENHHFRFVQFPLNLLEPQSAILPNIKSNGKQMSVIDFCAANKLVMLANRPLNATFGQNLYRLVTYRLDEKVKEHGLNQSLNHFEEKEICLIQFLKKNQLDKLPAASGKLGDAFFLTQILRQYMQQLVDVDQFNQFIYGFVSPRIQLGQSILMKALPPDAYSEGKEIMENYMRHFVFFSEILRVRILEKMQKKVEPVQKILDSVMDEKLRGLPLAHKSMLILLSTDPGLIILNGMRHIEYVKEMMKLLPLSGVVEGKKLLPEIYSKLVKKIGTA